MNHLSPLTDTCREILTRTRHRCSKHVFLHVSVRSSLLTTGPHLDRARNIAVHPATVQMATRRKFQLNPLIHKIHTLLAEAFPLCFSALYCHSLRGFGCSRFVLVVSFPRHRNNQNKTRAAKTAKRMAVQR